LLPLSRPPSINRYGNGYANPDHEYSPRQDGILPSYFFEDFGSWRS
jgi:hypothetical protein